MRFALITCLVFALPAFAQKKVTVKPDGTVTVENAPKAAVKAKACQCGPDCPCGPNCACGRIVATAPPRPAGCPCGPDCPCSPCKCAAVKATAPPRPAVILPPVVYGEPVYVGRPVRVYQPMPVRAVPVVPLYAEPPRRGFTLFGLDLGPVKVKLAEAK